MPHESKQIIPDFWDLVSTSSGVPSLRLTSVQASSVGCAFCSSLRLTAADPTSLPASPTSEPCENFQRDERTMVMILTIALIIVKK